MGRPLKVVVVGDSRNRALRVAADLEQAGYAPSFSAVSSEAELTAAAGADPDLVVAWRSTPSLPAETALKVLRSTGRLVPLFVYAETYTEEEIVGLVRAGATDCLRKGDLLMPSWLLSLRLRPPLPCQPFRLGDLGGGHLGVYNFLVMDNIIHIFPYRCRVP